MRWLFLVLAAVLLSGYEVKVKNVNGNTVNLDGYVKKGVSGVVMCPYEGKEIICARAVSLGNSAKLYVYDDLKNNAFALPLVHVKKGDRIIFEKDYDRVLIIAPNQETYLKTREKYKNFTVVNPDVFAVFLKEVPTKKDFVNFAKKLNIGRIVFVLDKIYETDAFSFYAVKKYGRNGVKYKGVFFTTYPKLGINGKNMIKYYKSLIKE
ncbi:plasminogen-binding N-terminal domain-containing protein [Nautilia sp.]